MLNNFRNLQSLYQALGAHWLIFRVSYALRLRTGLIRRQIPAYHWKDRPLETWLKSKIPSKAEAYAQWHRQNSAKFFFEPFRPEWSPQGVVDGQFPSGIPWNPNHAVNEAERILKGELKYFDHEFIKTGFPPDWHQDPVSGIRLDAGKHWSEFSDEGEADIKFIWEASRFSLVYPLVRAYASTRDERFAEAFWKLIQAWAEANPPNTGPNWMDGQEAAIRLMAWTFGFHAFLDSPHTTPERIAQFAVMVAVHAERIYKNIDYAISTHSNHTISEAFGLWLVGILFPELKDAEKYLALGRELLEQEAAAQIFPDGSYAMYALNYHRFILHIYFCAIRLGELNGAPFSEALKDRVARSVDYLYELIDPETGQMPVYGSNDGALILPLNNCDFTDYRPPLQLGSYLTKGTRFFESGAWDEPLFWLFGPQALQAKVDAPLQTGQSYADGGVSILRGSQSKAVIRCTEFRARPSHADQLHVDLWWHGTDLACDAGTYLYSGKGMWRNGLAHTWAHNTVIVDHRDQMKMVSRFTWTDWARGKVSQHAEKIWRGEHDGYKCLVDPVSHRRTVLSLMGERWLVVDHLNARQSHHYALHWLLCEAEYGVQKLTSPNFGVWLAIPDGQLPVSSTSGSKLPDSNVIGSKLPDSKVFIQMGLAEGMGNFSVIRADESSTRGWRSRYYGQKEPAISVMLEATQPQVCFWSYFGLESDSIELAQNSLTIRSGEWNTTVHLDPLNK
ncbi:MAG TPA: alginate lyase family protein [Anaerolineales bacterium]|nr:alginate lyase family protein [Anaerolineales bacterium]